jgi:hypothetical protein
MPTKAFKLVAVVVVVVVDSDMVNMYGKVKG